MQILGEIKIQGKPKKLLLKEEDGFFKYYILVLFFINILLTIQNRKAFYNDLQILFEKVTVV